MIAPIPCPKCGADLQDCGEITAVGWAQPSHDPEGKARVDLILDCEACAAQFNAFVALTDFQVVE